MPAPEQLIRKEDQYKSSPDVKKSVADTFLIKVKVKKLRDRELGRKGDNLKKANEIRKTLGIPTQGIAITSEAPTQDAQDQITPEQARDLTWYSSNTSIGEKVTPDGKKIYGLSLTTNPDYAQSYSKTKEINVFNLSQAKLKSVTFDYGMTIDDAKRQEILDEGFDGVIFDGMSGAEVALLNNVAKLESTYIPVPKGIQAFIEKRKSIPAQTVEEYHITLPDGYILEGDRYIFR